MLNSLQNKQLISLAAVMLLAHAVPTAIANSDIILDNDEKIFLNGYVSIGKILVYILLFSGLCWIVSTQQNINRLGYISTICNSIVIISIIVCSAAIIQNINIYPNNTLDKNALKLVFTGYIRTGKK